MATDETMVASARMADLDYIFGSKLSMQGSYTYLNEFTNNILYALVCTSKYATCFRNGRVQMSS